MPGDYSEELVELVARVLNGKKLFDEPAASSPYLDPLREAYRVEARAILDALSSSGHLVPEGSEVREEWGVRWPDGDVTYRTEQQAQDFATAYPGQPDAFMILRRVITTPWTPTEPEEKP